MLFSYRNTWCSGKTVSIIHCISFKKHGSVPTTLLNKSLLQKGENSSKAFLASSGYAKRVLLLLCWISKKVSLRLVMHRRGERLWKRTALFSFAVPVVSSPGSLWVRYTRSGGRGTVLPVPSLGGDVEEIFWAGERWGLCEVVGTFISKGCTKVLL